MEQTSLPPGWVMYLSEENGQEGWPYYFHEASGLSQWTLPEPELKQEAASVQLQMPVYNNTNTTAKATVAATLPSEEHADAEDMEEMCAFFKTTCSLSHSAARRAALESITRRISTPRKLARVWNRQALDLGDLHLDEDDAEEVAMALQTILTQTQSAAMNTNSGLTFEQQAERQRLMQYSAAQLNIGLQLPQQQQEHYESSQSAQQQHGYMIPPYIVQQKSAMRNGAIALGVGADGDYDADSNMEFFETESVYTHSTRGSHSQSHSHTQRNQPAAIGRQHSSTRQSRQKSTTSAGGNVSIDHSLWTELCTPEGQMYYYNTQTQLVQWENPYLTQSLQPPQLKSQPQQQTKHQIQTNQINLEYPHSLSVSTVTSTHSHQLNEVDDEDLSDLSSGSESRQRRSRNHTKTTKGTADYRQRRAYRASKLAAGGGTSTLPTKYSDTMNRVKYYSENADTMSRTSGSRNGRGGDAGPKPNIANDLPALEPRSLEVWNRFFENALKAKSGLPLEAANDTDNRKFYLPKMERNEWPQVLSEEAFADMIDVITSQPPSMTRDTNVNIALIYSTLANDIAVTERLLQLGADPNFFDSRRRTPLHYAAKIDSSDASALFFDNGADPEMQDDNGMVPLHTACIYGSVQVLRYLLESAAFVDAIDVDGNTALHLCAHSSLCAAECCMLLLEYDVSVVMFNKYGLHALAYARKIRRKQEQGVAKAHVFTGVSGMVAMLERLYVELGQSIDDAEGMNVSNPNPNPNPNAQSALPIPQESTSSAPVGTTIQMPPAAPMSPARSPGNKNKPAWVDSLKVNLPLNATSTSSHDVAPTYSGSGSVGYSNSNGNGSVQQRLSTTPAKISPAGSQSQSPQLHMQSSVLNFPRLTPQKGECGTGDDSGINIGNGNGNDNYSSLEYILGGLGDQEDVSIDWRRDVSRRMREKKEAAANARANASAGDTTSRQQSTAEHELTEFDDDDEDFLVAQNNGNNTSGIDGTLEESVGDKVVSAMWATASSLMGVTLNMFGENANGAVPGSADTVGSSASANAPANASTSARVPAQKRDKSRGEERENRVE